MLPGSKYLDCTHCDVAMQRVALETWATEAGLPTDEDELWKIYQHGRAAALEQAAKAVEDERLGDPGEADDIAYNMALDHSLLAIRALKP